MEMSQGMIDYLNERDRESSNHVKLESAKGLLAAGVSLDLIVKCINLSLCDIQKLATEVDL